MATTTLTGNTTYNTDQIIAAGDTLKLDPATSITVTFDNCSLVIRGKLESRPSSASVVHTFEFTNIDEDAFLGAFDHAAPQYDTDPGLWVLPRGQLDVYGTVKLPWTMSPGFGVGWKTSFGLPGYQAGATRLPLAQEPVGWNVGDEIVICPTAPPDSPAFLEFEERTITAVTAASASSTGFDEVQIDAPLSFDHPAVNVGRNRLQTPEVLNLTRNVIVKGTASGRSHLIVHAHHANHNLGYVRGEHLGPHGTRPQDIHWPDRNGEQVILSASPVYNNKATAPNSPGDPFKIPVLARWPFHFHHEGDDTDGQVVEGLVSYKNGSHAFVSHMSNGMTWKYCLSFGDTTAPFWWDSHGVNADTIRRTRPPDQTHRITYDRCVAADVYLVPNTDQLRFEQNFAPGWSKEDLRAGHTQTVWPGSLGPRRTGGFDMAGGNDNVATGCVAVGVGHGSLGDGGGFIWIEGGFGEWELTNNVAHNNVDSGWWSWANFGVGDHLQDIFVSYHNGKHGISWGAYANQFIFKNVVTHKNAWHGFDWHAQTGPAPILARIDDSTIDGLFFGAKRNAVHEDPTVIHNCELRGGVRIADQGGLKITRADFIDNKIDGTFDTSQMRSDSVVRVYNDDGFKSLAVLPAQLLPQVEATPDPTPDPDPTPAPVYFLRYSFLNDRSNHQPLQGAELRDSVFVFVGGEPDVSDITQVQWKLGGVDGVLDTTSPFDFKDTAGGGEANPWDTTAETDGGYVITAVVTDPTNGDKTLTANVTIANPVPEDAAPTHFDLPVFVESTSLFHPNELFSTNQRSVEADATGLTAENGATINRVTTEARRGAASLEIVTPGAAIREGAKVGTHTVVALDEVSSDPNTYAVSMWAKGAGTVLLAVNQYDVAVGLLETTDSAAVALSASEWKLLSVLVTCDPDVVTMEPFLLTSGTEAVIFHYDDGRFQRVVETDLPQMLITVQATAGNLLRVSAKGSVYLHGASSVIGRLRLEDSDNDRELGRWMVAHDEGTDEYATDQTSALLIQPDEAVSFKMTIKGSSGVPGVDGDVGAGTLDVVGDVLDPLYLLVEDLGPLALSPTGD